MIIGITGLPCSGTDTVGRFLVEKGFIWYSYSDLLREELRAKGEEITRKSMQDLANAIRATQGSDAMSKKLLAKMESGKNYVVGTIRNPGEVEALRKRKDFVLLGMHASPKIRFERMLLRNRESDPLTWEDFCNLELKEQGIGQASSGLRISDCLKLADKVIVNEGTFDELNEEVNNLLEQLKK